MATRKQYLFGRIDDTPFDIISGICQASQDDTEITPFLFDRGFDQTIDILKKQKTRFTRTNDILNRPPEHTFLTYNPFGSSTCHGIILARETTNKKIMFRDLVKNRIYVCIDILATSALLTGICLSS